MSILEQEELAEAVDQHGVVNEKMPTKDTVVQSAKAAEDMDVALIQSLLLNSMIEANHRFRTSPKFDITDVQMYHRMLAYLLRDRQAPANYRPQQRRN